LSPVAARGQQPEKCFLWTVTSKTATVHLFGTLHQGHPGLYPLPKEVEGAFTGSRTLAVELKAEAHRKEIDELFKTRRDYPDGETLSKSVSKETKDELHRFHEKRDFDIAAYERMRPWKAWVDLSGLNKKPKAAWSEKLGVDRYLLERAAANKKPVAELESVDDALWFTTLSAELQETLLRVMLADRNAGRDFPVDDLGAAWQAGDVAVVERIIIGDPVERHPKYKGVQEKCFDERNAKMAEKIEGYLKGTDTVFVAVGAGHLVGPKGIVRLLEGKGYRVTQMARAAKK
jgi:hypothetical protein